MLQAYLHIHPIQVDVSDLTDTTNLLGGGLLIQIVMLILI